MTLRRAQVRSYKMEADTKRVALACVFQGEYSTEKRFVP